MDTNCIYQQLSIFWIAVGMFGAGLFGGVIISIFIKHN